MILKPSSKGNTIHNKLAKHRTLQLLKIQGRTK